MADLVIRAVLLLALAACEPARVEPPPLAEPTLGAISRGSDDRDAPLVVLLHGYGARGDDLVPLAEELADRLPNVQFACLAAPHAMPEGGRYWWPREDRSLAIGARREVIRWLDANAPRAVIVAGFSQGAMLSIDVALEWDREVTGIGALSGAPIDLERWTERLTRRRPSLFISHGRADRVLAYEDAEAIAARFRDANAEVRFVAFEGGHTIPPAVRDAFRAYLEERAR
jgi:phospholipase/carboxylesterase